MRAGRFNDRLLPGNEIESGEIYTKRASGKGNTRERRWTRTRRRDKRRDRIFARDSALEVTSVYPFTSSIFVFRSSERFP